MSGIWKRVCNRSGAKIIPLILHVSFGSGRLALLVILDLPFAFICGVLVALLGSGVLSLSSLIGFITVLGISARNSIMLISHYDNLEKKEGQHFDINLIVRCAMGRLVPILMTTLTTGLACCLLLSVVNFPAKRLNTRWQ